VIKNPQSKSAPVKDALWIDSDTTLVTGYTFLGHVFTVTQDLLNVRQPNEYMVCIAEVLRAG
jgi:hypothetical protein